MESNELVLDRGKLLAEAAILSPAKEAEYRAKLDVALTENISLKEEVAELKQQLAWFKKQLYGQKSEKTEVVLDKGEQTDLFNEAEVTESRREEERVTVTSHTRKAKRTHEETFENLPVEEVVHEVKDKTCPDCGTQMEPVGKEFVRDELVYVPAKMFVRKHYVEVVKCPVCGTDETVDADHPDVPAPVFRKATAPTPLIPHSYCSPELLAHIIYEKYAKAVPLYRLEKDFAAMGVKLSRTTLANWVIYAARTFAEPVFARMKAELLSGKIIHADETVVQVLHEPGKKAKTNSRMWVYCAAKSSGKSNILFEYAPTRNGDHAKRFLGDYKGYLVCDGYDGYNKLIGGTRCGCFAHVRRKFVDALPTDPALLATSQAAQGVEWCNQLYTLEREYDGKDEQGKFVREPLPPEEKLKQRQERSKTVLDGFFAWLSDVHPTSGTKLAAAVQYALNEKKYICRFLDDPDLPIDNNRAENAIRPFVIGRKNWLFSDSIKGAQASAMLYSLAVTATANGLNAERYFDLLFTSRQPILPWLD